MNITRDSGTYPISVNPLTTWTSNATINHPYHPYLCPPRFLTTSKHFPPSPTLFSTSIDQPSAPSCQRGPPPSPLVFHHIARANLRSCLKILAQNPRHRQRSPTPRPAKHTIHQDHFSHHSHLRSAFYEDPSPSFTLTWCPNPNGVPTYS